jgi:hypothetical protein
MPYTVTSEEGGDIDAGGAASASFNATCFHQAWEKARGRNTPPLAGSSRDAYELAVAQSQSAPRKGTRKKEKKQERKEATETGGDWM